MFGTTIAQMLIWMILHSLNDQKYDVENTSYTVTFEEIQILGAATIFEKIVGSTVH